VTVVLRVSDDFVEVTVSFETKAVCAVVRGVGNARSLRSRKLYRLPNQIRYDVVVENKLWRKTSAAFKPICRFTLERYAKSETVTIRFTRDPQRYTTSWAVALR
jgi:hypothetical protein